MVVASHARGGVSLSSATGPTASPSESFSGAIEFKRFFKYQSVAPLADKGPFFGDHALAYLEKHGAGALERATYTQIHPND